MFTKNISFINFQLKKKDKSTKSKLNLLLINDDQVVKSLRKSYKDTYSKKIFKIFKKKLDYRIIGMGGSSLGSQAIYDFLKYKIKKNFFFVNNLQAKQKIKSNKLYNNLIISKSGNTIETIVNSNVLIKKKEKNLLITENKDSYLKKLAKKLSAEVVDHNNFIGGRYSVLSEVGMLPAELMGLNPRKFRQFDNIVKNKNFLNLLIHNTGAIFHFSKKKFNSIIINYDEKSNYLFQWYQQLVAESLGKKSKGLLPIISSMPKDNHSLMQLYLDGPMKSFYTFFYVQDKNSIKLKSNQLLPSMKYLKNKNINEIIYSQKIATENVFKKRQIPFRSFEILKRDEKSLGELFSFFILETILLGRALDVNPFDQPSVELIKKETKKILI